MQCAVIGLGEYRTRTMEALGKRQARPLKRWGNHIHFALVALAPAIVFLPDESRMLVLPLAPSSARASTAWLRESGAKLVGPGPVAGSFLIDAADGAPWLPAIRNGAILIRASWAGCGAATQQLR
ncbi:hypothetical protein [Novosphingobium sp. M1R2S20]|uniref:Uncharacterized protein n=1 Tax=Novosphingobium rhizovicinum TaxID=3228928 RepID=A0ABV3RAV8_9SPHN